MTSHKSLVEIRYSKEEWSITASPSVSALLALEFTPLLMLSSPCLRNGDKAIPSFILLLGGCDGAGVTQTLRWLWILLWPLYKKQEPCWQGMTLNTALPAPPPPPRPAFQTDPGGCLRAPKEEKRSKETPA